MSLNHLNMDILSSIVQSLDIASIRALVTASPHLQNLFRTANDFWRALIVRDFGFLPMLTETKSNNASNSANTNNNNSNASNNLNNSRTSFFNSVSGSDGEEAKSSQQQQPAVDPHHYYDLYRRASAASYNLQFGVRTSLALDWTEFRRHRYSGDEKTLLDCSIGSGPLCKPFPFPASKILPGFDSVVVHEFVIGEEKLSRIERAIVKNALRVMCAKLFQGVYRYDQHKHKTEEGSNNSNSKAFKNSNEPREDERLQKERRKKDKRERQCAGSEMPIQFHFTETSAYHHVLYFAYFYNARTVMKPGDGNALHAGYRPVKFKFARSARAVVLEKRENVSKRVRGIYAQATGIYASSEEEASNETTTESTSSDNTSDEERLIENEKADMSAEELRAFEEAQRVHASRVSNCVTAFWENYRIAYEQNADRISGISFIYRQRNTSSLDDSLLTVAFMLHESYMRHKHGIEVEHSARLSDTSDDENGESKHQPNQHRSSYRINKYSLHAHAKGTENKFTFDYAKQHNNVDLKASSGNKGMYTFDVPIEADHFCSTDFWNFFCLFGLLCDKHWRFSEPNASPFADWNVRYVPTLQKLYYKNFSFYALSGSPGCISFELPEAVGNMWRKKSIWRGLLLKPARLHRMKEFVLKNPQASLEGQAVAYNDFEDTDDTSSDISTDTDTDPTASSSDDSDDDSLGDGAYRATRGAGEMLDEMLRIGFQEQAAELAAEGVDEALVLAILQMGFIVDRKTIVECLRIDGTVETAVAAIISNM